MRLAFAIISSKLATSRVRTAWAPQSRPILHAREGERVAKVLGHAAYVLVHAVAGGDVVRDHAPVSYLMQDIMHSGR